VGYDGSPASRDALAWAAGAARRSGGRLVVAFVVPPVPPMSAATPIAYAATAVQLEGAEDVVDEVADELRDYGVGWELVVTHGDPAEELERVADTFRADVMVVGRSMGIHVLSGSVPRRLLHRAHRPLLVVP
jgi:nucleotide-binding universal stress UspA family protein